MMPILDRRTFLTGAGAIYAGGAFSERLFAKSKVPFFRRVQRPIGLQLYTLGEVAAPDLEGTLSRVAAIGYRDIELAGLFGLKAVEVKAAADRAGLSLSSMHLSGLDGASPGTLSFDSEPQRLADDLGTLGINRLILPMPPFSASGAQPFAGEDWGAAVLRIFTAAGADLWKRTAAMLNEKAAAMKPFGISVGYHNHNIEFASVGSMTGWDILWQQTDPGLVTFELDIAWLAAAGLDPIAFLHKHRGRVRQLHVKDVGASTKPNFAFLMEATEVGSGTLDWAKILPAAYAAGVRHFYVEQEAFTTPPMESIAKSFDYLSKLAA
ncbi:sugar phosphate isomerase/epimerase family protein [Sphingobium boeckii]|uniref:Sugar phosphate isomerase/epimerase n=1 Tax=Sphingobium boeckii TaxID=1082345 RepID=A0A7W9AHC5_9SPHN|nr:sugar phosphate isomerase/epimerase [Sphingobium boeckii]MBB5685664.1 sugar phosphate isomerase/epimerase [Sphingobium boeckii]